MSQHTVEKIGGTSMAATDTVLKNVLIAGKTGEDLYNRIFVVSAYAGITNKLLEHKKTGEPGVFALFADATSERAWSDAITGLGEAMHAINADVLSDRFQRRIADDFVRDRIEGIRGCLIDLQRLCSYGHFNLQEHLTTVREMLSALGEAHSAYTITLLLREQGVNAAFMDLTGWRDDSQPTLDERIKNAFEKVDLRKELPIVTGYAHCHDGLMKSFGRGYTEVTFSRIASLTNACQAIIHKEFHLSSADPKVVGADKVRKIGRTNYDVADQLSNMGMEAIHPRAAKGLRQAQIPLCIRNTFDPDDAGTQISGDYVSQSPRTEIVTGLRSVLAIEFFEQDMVGVKGYDAAILDALARHKVYIVSKSSNANTITHYVAGTLKSVNRTVADLEAQFPSADVMTRKVSIVSAIGSDMNVPGLVSRALEALSKAGVPLIGLQKVTRNVDIQFIVDRDAFDDAVKVLHRALVEEDGCSRDHDPSRERKAAA